MNAAPQPELELPITESLLPPKQAAARWASAVHEAGHAVVSIFYEIPLTSMRIDSHGVRGKRFVTGLVCNEYKTNKPPVRGPERARWISKLIVIKYAGFFAEQKANPSANGDGSWEDYDSIHKLLLKKSPCKRKPDLNNGSQQPPAEAEIARAYNALSRRLVLIAGRLVDWLYPIIVMVAHTLLERRRMTGEEVVALAGPLIAKKRAAMNRPRRLKNEILD